jgi:type IV pilus assembly protein PilV
MKSTQQGFTLVEVLVALAVLSFGLLGIAVLFATGFKAGRTALVHTQAVTLAADLAERMRANRVPAGAYACLEPCDPAAAGDGIAEFDLAEWLANVHARLPGGDAVVVYETGDGAMPETYTIELHWLEPGRAEPASLRLRVET